VRQVDAIAVTHGPGLAGSLLVGVNAAKGLAFASGLPLLPVNHLEGHVYSNWVTLDNSRQASTVPADRFPVVILIVSGGHTELLLMTSHCHYQRLGGTLDDAAGEAFDKVARLLNLGFPGGPALQRAAQQGDPTRYLLPRALAHSVEHRFNFSFSGLKTAVLNLVRKLEVENAELGIRNTEYTSQSLPHSALRTPHSAFDVAASFQAAVADVLVNKTADAAQHFGARQVCICGGVSANAGLRAAAERRFAELGLPLHIPPLALCTDNAAMIGAAAFYRWQHLPNAIGDLGLDVSPNLPLA
jgi:N6-L-threonylcarbamoyladenine synthase